MILVDSSVWIDYFRGTATAQVSPVPEAEGLAAIDAAASMVRREVKD